MKLAILHVCVASLFLALAQPATLSANIEVIDESVKAATPKVSIPQTIEQGVKLQIFLDQKQFGPGIIDGRPGTFTKLAIENYNTSLGRAKNDTQIHQEVKDTQSPPYATAIIPSDVAKYVNAELPTDREKQAEMKYMSYRSVLEFMSERYHVSENLLIDLNGKKVAQNAAARSALIVPNVTPFKIEDLKAGKSHLKEENLTARHIVVNTDVKQVYIYELKLPPIVEGTTAEEEEEAIITAKPLLIASFPITPGKTQFIPKGYWNLKNSIELPTWRYDKLLLETGVRGKESLNIPAGPNNPVGIIWNGLTKSGIGIHGTNNPNTIGRARSAGCIRLTNWDAARIPQLVRPGAVVVIE